MKHYCQKEIKLGDIYEIMYTSPCFKLLKGSIRIHSRGTFSKAFVTYCTLKPKGYMFTLVACWLVN
jgi:hypothetical protein